MRSTPFALLLAAALSLLSACHGSRDTDRAANAPAAPTISITSPRGQVGWPFDFEWATDASASAVCRVSVFDTAERPVLQMDSRARRLPAPPDLERLLGTTRTFLWKVAVLDQQGETAAQTPLTPFTVK